MGLKVYTKYGCPKCDMTKMVLDGEEISYEAINVEDDAEAMSFIKDELEISSMPVVIKEGHEPIVGFEPEKLKKLK